MKKINYNFNDLSVNVFIYLFTASDKNRHWALDWTDQWLELTIESCTWPKIEVFPLNTSCDLQAGDDNRHRCRLCFFVSFFLLGHSEVETSRTSPRVAPPCSCLPALREGFAVNKRLGHQRGGVIHAVVSWCHTLYQCTWNTSSDQNLRSSQEVWITSGNLANTPFPHVQSFVFRIWWLKHVAVFCHNVFQGEESRHGRMSTEGGRLHWTAGCPSVTGPGPVYKWRSR